MGVEANTASIGKSALLVHKEERSRTDKQTYTVAGPN